LIAYNKDADVQVALAQACEAGKVTKKDLLCALRVANFRRAFGPQNVRGGRQRAQVTRDSVVETIRKETELEQQALRRVELGEKYLAMCRHSLAAVFRAPAFLDLLRQEGLQSIPEVIATVIAGEGNAFGCALPPAVAAGAIEEVDHD
jgi:hypothetical protein